MGDVEILLPREVPLGGPRAMTVRRTLPHKVIRTVGAWCFLDHYGPNDLDIDPGMDVPPHPHTGLQTVTWLLEGQVLHHDSLGSTALIRHGELNLMTAGRGIAHSEQSVPSRVSNVLEGVQLWVALPDAARNQEPHFEHHDDLPVFDVDDAQVTLIIGQLDGERSPAATYSPLVGAEVFLEPTEACRLPLDPAFEYAVLVLSGSLTVAGRTCDAEPLVYLGTGRETLEISAGRQGALMLLLGGEPFAEHLLMWWNFVGRTHEEIAQARADWAGGDGRRFGAVTAYPGAALQAPPMPTTRLTARPSQLPPYP